MKLTEPEMRMAYQLESTSQVGILNELHMTCRYSQNRESKATAESLMAKIRTLSDKECMALVNDVQKNYRLPGKARTIGEMLAEARQKSGAEKLAGHDIMALERFDPDTRHMIVFDVLSHESPMGYKGERMRLFLTEQGYQKARENQDRGFIKIRNHAKVTAGNLRYDAKDRDLGKAPSFRAKIIPFPLCMPPSNKGQGDLSPYPDGNGTKEKSQGKRPF